MLNYILVCDSAYGTYYIGKGSQEEMNQMQRDIDKYSTGTLKVIKYDGDDLDDLIENTVEFNKKFRGSESVTATPEKEPEKIEKEPKAFELDTSEINLVPEDADGDMEDNSFDDPFAETEKLELQNDDKDPFNNKEDINQAELDKLREEADDGDEDLFDDES